MHIQFYTLSAEMVKMAWDYANNESGLTPTVAQKTAPMFAYYIKTHVLLNADMI